MPDAAQTRGSYALIDRLREAYPDVEIESCASGGGRIDFGILGRTHRVWLSDGNDAVERLTMQHDAAIFLPMAVTGSHVGPRTCHTSGRTIDIRFRAWVAAQRHMGFELDPRELKREEKRVLGKVIRWWKENRDWIGPQTSFDSTVRTGRSLLSSNWSRVVVNSSFSRERPKHRPRSLRGRCD